MVCLKELIKTDAKVAACILAWINERYVDEIADWGLESAFLVDRADPQLVLQYLHPELADLQFHDGKRIDEYYYVWLQLGEDFYEFSTDYDSWEGHEFSSYDVTGVRKGTFVPKTIMVFEGR